MIHNDDQIQAYISSKYCLDKYKNKSVDELLQIQYYDSQLEKELDFFTQFARVSTRAKRLGTEFDKLFIYFSKIQAQKLQESIELGKKPKTRNFDIPKLVIRSAAPVTTKSESTKAYIKFLTEDQIPEGDWSEIELLIRTSFIQEMESLVSKGGCTSCARNAVLRKYVSRLTKLKTLASETQD